MKNQTHHRRGLYAPELLEARIAPATFLVTSLVDNGTDTAEEITLREAIDLANARPGKDTIKFDKALLPGTIVLNGTQIVITDKVDIKGPGLDMLAVDAAAFSRVFRIDDGDFATDGATTISGLTITGGKNAGGGGIYSKESLTLSKVAITNNVGTSDGGGGIRVDATGAGGKSKLIIKDSIITGNQTVTGSGAGLYGAASGGILISKSTISGNQAGNNGGGMYLRTSGEKSSIIVDGSTIAGNTAASGDGGGLLFNHSAGGKILVKNSVITGNSAERSGGVEHRNGALTATKTIFSNNTAAVGDAGAIRVAGTSASASIVGSSFFSNRAEDHGGAISFDQAQPSSVKSSLFFGNSAGENGGAIFATAAGSLEVKSSLILGNKATDDGGGLSVVNGGDLLLTSSTVSGNEAGQRGGGVATGGEGVLLVKGGKFEGNKAMVGGAITAVGGGAMGREVNLLGVQILGNRASSIAGGVDTDGTGAVLVKGAKVIGNTAVNEAGGMYLRSDTSVTVVSSLFQRNFAGGRAGGLALEAATGLVTGSKFFDNATDGDGGGIFINAVGTVAIVKSTVTGNISGTSGGGIYNDGGPVDLKGSKIFGNFAPVNPNITGPVL